MNKAIPTLNREEVKKVTDASHTATSTMIALGFRQRAHANTNLSAVRSELLQMNEQINDKDFMDFWKGLEKAGAGSLILGRRGKQTRFEWNYSLRQIAQIAIEGKSEELSRFERMKAEGVKAPKVKEPAKDVKADEMFVVSVPLKDGSKAQMFFPRKPTVEEFEQMKSCFGQ